MCGITAILSQEGVSASCLSQMNALIRHRGVDGEGYVVSRAGSVWSFSGGDTPSGVDLPPLPSQGGWDGPVVALAHRRLAILDVSAAGHQPMSYANQRFWISYNGEIFNFVELRDELEALGYVFSSGSDTEVVLASYQQWGEDCLTRFNGMWAFAVWDREQGTFFAARDRFGVKPLYYWCGTGRSIYFFSEIKQLTVAPGWQARVNPQRAYDYLAWGLSDHTEETLFAGVYQIPPGCFISLDLQRLSAVHDGKLNHIRWYELVPRPFFGGFPDAAAEFFHLLKDSISLRLRADVSIGSCLSGGLDSSGIVCIANSLLRQRDVAELQKTFSACAIDPRFDERKWIDAVVDATGVDAHYCYPAVDSLFSELPAIAWHQDEPFGSTSIFAQWSVFQLAAQNDVKVMLDGQGADEQLAGYYSYFGPRFAGLFKQWQFDQLFSEIAAVRDMHGRSMLRSLFGMLQVMLPAGSRSVLRAIVGGVASSPPWLDMEALGAQPIDPNAALGVYSDSVAALSRAQLTGANLQMLLHWEDRNSMAHGIESRVPYLDYRLVEFVLGLPEEYKLSGGVTKRVQRAALQGVIPEKTRSRADKLGFVTPESVWMKEHSPDLFRDLMERARRVCSGVLNERSTLVLEDVIAGRRPFDFSIWRMLSFGQWVDRFDVRLQ
ncbi:asparagine synthase (glutamine-hydrolyzing) [Rhodocyclus tenuis]|uniref:asparagine synthase (glutamine-hydrolyzing) n=1 Tax=Rhodocyclus gracilis TaxID=2929842 RepID=UPI001298CD5B|nr:asparagine synthase (glutamine-hydrolyzing) [Rhodocyclus gracilis]MRD72309.1 asparagine synthase (glutamine-hydrolyzing) [Rhodocyclus gracilis]